MEVQLKTVTEARDYLDQVIAGLDGKKEVEEYVDDLKWLSNQLYLLQ